MTKTLHFLHFLTLLIFTAICCIWLASCAPRPSSEAVSLNFASGPQAREALAELAKEYRQEKPNITINYTFSGATALQERIEKKEPFDIILLSSKKSMDELDKKGLLLSETRTNLVGAQMVLVVPADSDLAIADFKDLTSDRLKTVAMGTERLGAGQYTKEILSNLGIWSQVQSKAVWANVEVREILKAVETKEADVGIVFLPEAKLSQKVKVVAIAPSNSYTPIITRAAVLKNSQHPLAAKELLKFLASDKALPIFKKHGFIALPSSSAS